MKKLKWILPLLILTVMLGGCPYGSTIPLDTTGKKINKELLGTWEPKSSSDEQYKITKDDEFTYKIVKSSKTPKNLRYTSLPDRLDGNCSEPWEENAQQIRPTIFISLN